jgi:two-component system, OmpR family, response regulator
MAVARLLLIEDDPRIVSFLKPGLKAESYSVEVARDGREGLDMARSGEFALIVLDHMLPGLNGLEVCARLREEGCQSLILMLTAKDRLEDKIAGLKGGADDYLTKPFAFGELIARIEALLRRKGETERGTTILRVADLSLDLTAKAVWRGQRQIDLTPKEFALLAYLMANAGTVVSRQNLLSNVWGLNFDPGTKVVDVYIRYLRLKVDRDGDSPLIRTVRGFGYTMPADRNA